VVCNGYLWCAKVWPPTRRHSSLITTVGGKRPKGRAGTKRLCAGSRESPGTRRNQSSTWEANIVVAMERATINHCRIHDGGKSALGRWVCPRAQKDKRRNTTIFMFVDPSKWMKTLNEWDQLRCA
jgi:hypothetical protein